MADKKSEVRIPEEHLHLNGKRHHLPVVWVWGWSKWVGCLMMAAYTYCGKDLKSVFE